jgi:hypothetical protein
MPFTPQTAAAAGRKGGRSVVQKYGTEHMRAIGKKGFAALARKLGYMGGSRRMALTKLIGRGKLRDLGPDPGPAQEWVERVLDAFDPESPEIPY